MLRNWILGSLAIAIWTANWVIYVVWDLHVSRQQRHYAGADWHAPLPQRSVTGPLPPNERRRFPPPPPPPVRDAEIIPFPKRRRFRRNS